MQPRLSVRRTQKRDRHYNCSMKATKPFEMLTISKSGSEVKLLVQLAARSNYSKGYVGYFVSPRVKGGLEVGPPDK